MTDELAVPPRATPIGWRLALASLRRPHRVTLPMILLVALVPFYIFIPEIWPPAVRYRPAVPLDRAFPLVPAWALIYGALYLFLILLPVLVVRQDDLIRRTVFAYLLIWITAYLCFVLYPTAAPRPARVAGEGFAVWGLRALYSSDPPYNCFPSLHVAHSFVSALACSRVHRTLGVFATGCAALVALSTLFTRQHYLLDVVAGVLLAYVAHAVFLRNYARERIPELDRRAAPALAVCVSAVAAIGVACYWLLYRWMGATRFEFGP